MWDRQQTEQYDDEREKRPFPISPVVVHVEFVVGACLGIRWQTLNNAASKTSGRTDGDQAGVRDTDSKMLFKTD